MSGALDPHMEQQYTGQFFQPVMLSGTVGSRGTDYSEEEPTLLEGKKSKIFFGSL